jgi:L-alanine-DL-glutamate epimerase-like enolase superfamily enzyme
VKITSIESRVLGYDITEAWGGAEPPEGISSNWYQYSFDTFHTDEGIDGYTMQNANLRDGAAMARVLHDLYAPQLIGENPLETERLWHKLRRLNRHAYNLSDSVAGAIDVAFWDIRGKVANMPIGSLLGLARTRIGAYATARNIDPTPEDVFEEARLRKSQGYHGFKIQFWDGLDRDIPRYLAAREAVGDGYPLMQDAAGMYSFTEAMAAGNPGDHYTPVRGAHPRSQPVPACAAHRAATVPILSGETSRVYELAEGMRLERWISPAATSS